VETIGKVLAYYRHRWKIEQTHRQLKQDYNWESMQLLKYQALTNMNMIFWIANSLLYSCKEQIVQWAVSFPRLFSQYLKNLKGLYELAYSPFQKLLKLSS